MRPTDHLQSLCAEDWQAATRHAFTDQLAARTRTQMQDLAAEHLKGRTVLMVTHDPAEAARMGHAIHILTETGLEDVTPPPGTVPRPVDDPETLTAQGRLLARLRAPA